jgi:hypothetical protein
MHGDSIMSLPGSTEARELMVRRALEYPQQIEGDANDDPASLRDLAAACERLGRIRAEDFDPHLAVQGRIGRRNSSITELCPSRRNFWPHIPPTR